MNFTIDLILFTAIGILFLYITIACKIIYRFLKHMERLIIRSHNEEAIEFATKLYKLHRDYLAENKHLKTIKRSQTHSKKREREILTHMRALVRQAKKPMRFVMH